MTYARKTDKRHKEIVKGLRDTGFSVRQLFRLNDDGPDLLIGKHGFDVQVEIKTLIGRKNVLDLLNDEQAEFRDEWRGARVIVAADLEGILFSFSMLTKRGGFVR